MGANETYDVVIIGGGLSGLTCGLYLQEAGMKVLILERAPQAGGLTTSWRVHEQGACLSIARIFYDKKITDEKCITGTSRRAFVFNGCQDIGNIMPRYGNYPGSVVDVLADRAESLQQLPVGEFLNLVIRDLGRVWPQAKDAEVKLALGAHIHPAVLYHKEVPRLPGERNRLVKTPLHNLVACNCSLGLIGIGMESAYQAGKLAANRILKPEGKPTVHVHGIPEYEASLLCRMGYQCIRGFVIARNLLGKIVTSL